MNFIIYQTTNKINGKIYIGKHKTVDLDDGYLGSGTLLLRAISKYGIENFEREVLHFLDSEEEMNTKERELVNEEFLKRDDVYNLKIGGEGGFDFLNRNQLNNANKDRKAIGRKIGKQLKGRKHPERGERLKRLHEEGKIRYDTFTGKTHTESAKAILSEKGKRYVGEANSQFGSFWITNGVISQKLKQGETIPDGWYRGRK